MQRFCDRIDVNCSLHKTESKQHARVLACVYDTPVRTLCPFQRQSKNLTSSACACCSQRVTVWRCCSSQNGWGPVAVSQTPSVNVYWGLSGQLLSFIDMRPGSRRELPVYSHLCDRTLGCAPLRQNTWLCTFVTEHLAVHLCDRTLGCAPLWQNTWLCTFVTEHLAVHLCDRTLGCAPLRQRSKYD
jgi:hypothetical protein